MRNEDPNFSSGLARLKKLILHTVLCSMSPSEGSQCYLSRHCVVSPRSIFFVHAILEQRNSSSSLGCVPSCVLTLDKPLVSCHPLFFFFFAFPMGSQSWPCSFVRTQGVKSVGLSRTIHRGHCTCPLLPGRSCFSSEEKEKCLWGKREMHCPLTLYESGVFIYLFIY